MRFYGEALDESTMPIYELGQILVATQRVINKSYKAQENRPFSSKLSIEERNKLALQISDRRKGSDILDFIGYWIRDPFVGGMVANVTVSLLESTISAIRAFSIYSDEKVVEEIENSDNPGQTLVFNMFSEMNMMCDQINRENGVRGFNFLPNQRQFPDNNRPIDINEGTRRYLKRIEGRKIRSKKEIALKGKIHRFNENTDDITLNTGYEKIRVKFNLFSDNPYMTLRRDAGNNAPVLCQGYFVSELGKSRPVFEATKIEVL
jgi:hypothetical protein